jgi:hypothetical protein
MQPVISSTPRILSIEELIAMKPPGWLLDGLLPAEGLVLCFGRPNVGKSFVALDIALTLAAGLREWQGISAHRSGVVLYASPEGNGGLGQRIGAWLERHPDNAPEVKQNFFLVTEPIHPHEESTFFRVLQAAKARTANLSPILLVIDTLAANAPGANDSDAPTMSAITYNLGRFTAATGATCLLLHHTPQDKSNRERGSGVLRGAVDVALRVDRSTDNMMTVRVDKARDFQGGAQLKLQRVICGNSCVVELASTEQGLRSPPAQSGRDDTKPRILAAIEGAAPKAVSRAQLLKSLEGVPAATLTRHLKSMVDSGEVEKPKRGHYLDLRLSPPSAGLCSLSPKGER